MQIYLVRHTPVNVPANTCYGRTDVPLAHTFEQDSYNVINKLQGFFPQVVYSSPAQRCVLLAKTISSEVIIDHRLHELDFGDWEMKPWKSITGGYAEQWMNDFVNTKCPNGESYLDLFYRVKSFYEEITIKQQWHRVVIVTHGGVIRTFFAITGKCELKDTFSYTIPLGSVWHFIQLNNIQSSFAMK